MKTSLNAMMLIGAMVAGGCSQTAATSTGPNGGDVVPIKGGTAYAELLANADTGQVLVNTWDKDLKTKRPIEKEPITLGSGDNSLELTPHPLDTDPAGTCSRFYGEANWVRGGSVHQGWLHGGGAGEHQAFEWSRCWQGGQAPGPMWTEMREHGHMGPGHFGGERE